MDLLRFLFSSMLNWYASLGNSGMATLRETTITELSNAIPAIWDTKVRIDAARKAFWGSRFTGPEGSNKPVIERTDFTKMPGDTIKINVLSQLLRAGVTNESTLQGNEEKLSLGQFTVTLTLVRNAVAVTELAQRRVNFDTVRAIGNMLSSWLARKMDDDLWVELLITNPPTTIYAGSATSRATLGQASIFNTQAIDRLKLALQRQGALPIRIQMDDQQELEFYGLCISEIDEYNLKGDDAWNQAQRLAGIRGDQNHIFSGALGMYNGVVLYVHRSVRMSGYFGSAIRPEASVSIAMAAGDTSVTVGPSTSDSSINYLRFFPQSGTNTVLVDNELMSYTGITNNTLTGLTRGITGTTAATHAVGAIITLNNVSKAIGFGSEVGARVWGLYPQRIRQMYDYENEIGIGVKAYYGQRAIQNNAGSVINSVIMETYGKNVNPTI